MSGTAYLLDTNIVLYLLRGDKDIPSLIKGSDIYLSFITEMELLSFPGLTQEEKSKIESLLENVFVADFNSEIKKTAIRLRSKYRLKLPDSLVAATSAFLNIQLISADKSFAKSRKLTSY
ncbi:MAG TPA: type II toxin-antitoxin system VapC family toxin [Cyclobacteriaceae bacterium]|nr:type II toxin-antitoxin system VapC family toxin [Cyclobacteriaceae bacterium]